MSIPLSSWIALLVFSTCFNTIAAQNVSCRNITDCYACASSPLKCGWCAGSKTCVPPLGVLNSNCSADLAFGSAIDCAGCASSFFPCSTNISQSVFLIIFYGAIILVCAKVISFGAEILLELLPQYATIIGALLLPLLGSLPDACMIVASGALGTVEEAQTELNVGIGALAGSTVMLLTIPWSASLVLGSCDIDDNNEQVDGKRSSWNVARVGITVDNDTRINARLMCFSMLFFFIVQGVCFAFVNQTAVTPELVAAEKPAAIAGFVVCIVALLAYCAFQIALPALTQKKRIRKEQMAKERQDRLKAIFILQHFPGATKMIHEQFYASPTKDHLHANVLHFARVWKELALNIPQLENDFEYNVAHINSQHGVQMIHRTDFLTLDEEESESQEEQEAAETKEGSSILYNRKFRLGMAVAMLIASSFCVAVFSDPMVSSMSTFGNLVGISPFYVAFVVSPILGNAAELVSAMAFAAKKRKANISLSISQLYGSVIMNNTLGLGIFFALIAFRGLAWQFTAETMTMVLAAVLVGLPACFLFTYRLYWVFLNAPVYILCIVFVWLLEAKAGIL